MIAAHQVNPVGGDVFDHRELPSDGHILWGELIKDKERRLLEQHLRPETVHHACRGNDFLITVRTVWRPEAQLPPRDTMTRRKGRFVMLLHSTSGRCTTSWTWLKLVRPLYQVGLSVILVDLPGLGASAVDGEFHAHPSVWKSQETAILVGILDELRVSKCHLVAYGPSCSALVRMVRDAQSGAARRCLEREHILHNPVLDFAELLKDAVRVPPGGAIRSGTGTSLRDVLRDARRREFEGCLATSGVRILATFDQSDSRTHHTYEAFMLAQKHIVLSHTITCIEVTREDVCEAQIGANVPIYFLFLRKHLSKCYTQFLYRQKSRPPAFEPASSEYSSSGVTPSFISEASEPPQSDRTMGQSARHLGQSASVGALEHSGTPQPQRGALAQQAAGPRSAAGRLPAIAVHRSAPSLLHDSPGGFGPGSPRPGSGGGRAFQQVPGAQQRQSDSRLPYASGSAGFQALEGATTEVPADALPSGRRHRDAGSELSGSALGSLPEAADAGRARRPNFYDAARGEALRKLLPNPQDLRRRLLSTLPASVRSTIAAANEVVDAHPADAEPQSLEEERAMAMIGDAVQASLIGRDGASAARSRRSRRRP